MVKQCEYSDKLILKKIISGTLHTEDSRHVVCGCLILQNMIFFHKTTFVYLSYGVAYHHIFYCANLVIKPTNYCTGE